MKVQMKKYIFILFIALLVSSDSLSKDLLRTCSELLMPNSKQKGLSESELLKLNNRLFNLVRDGGRTRLIKKLLKAGANVNHQDEYGNTALRYASRYNNIEIVRLLLKFRANVNLQNNDGWTALITASMRGDVEIVRLLLKFRANVDLQSNLTGNTALIFASDLHYFASGGNYIEIVRLLLENGANVNHQNKFGKTALWFARDRGHTGIERLLKEAGATE